MINNHHQSTQSMPLQHPPPAGIRRWVTDDVLRNFWCGVGIGVLFPAAAKLLGWDMQQYAVVGACSGLILFGIMTISPFLNILMDEIAARGLIAELQEAEKRIADLEELLDRRTDDLRKANWQNLKASGNGKPVPASDEYSNLLADSQCLLLEWEKGGDAAVTRKTICDKKNLMSKARWSAAFQFLARIDLAGKTIGNKRVIVAADAQVALNYLNRKVSELRRSSAAGFVLALQNEFEE